LNVIDGNGDIITSLVMSKICQYY